MVSFSLTTVSRLPLNRTLAMVQQVTFSQWLTEQMQRQGFNQTTLGERAGLSPQYIGSLVRNAPHSITGKPVVPTVEAVDKIARALGVAPSEARLVAGYAPASQEQFRDQIEDEEIAFLASQYKEIKELAPEDQQAEIRGLLRVVRRETERVLREAKAKKKK